MCLTIVIVLRVFVRDVRGQGAVNWAAWALSCVNISLKPSPASGFRPSQTSEKSGAHREEDCHVSRETKSACMLMSNDINNVSWDEQWHSIQKFNTGINSISMKQNKQSRKHLR